MAYTPKQVALEEFDVKIKSGYVEVSTSALGAEVVACSDDFFVSRHNLIKPGPSISMKGQFGPNGALYDGWESRRHNPTFDWVIIRLATPSTTIEYVDIDTSHFSGNEAPQSQIFALTPEDVARILPSSGGKGKFSPSHPGWTEILPVVDLGPNSRHIFQVGGLGQKGHWGALMVRMIPDGGMARFRAYGSPIPPALPSSLSPNYKSQEPIDLLSPLIGGRIISCSDANFSPPQNLLLPGRGFDMSDGWETRRSQHARGKKEWVIAKLGVTGVIGYVEVDTAFHPGNYPVACAIEATLSSDGDLASAEWTTVIAKKPLGPHRQHYFDVEKTIPEGQVWSHIRYTIYPDGGSKRVRVFGYPLAPSSALPATAAPQSLTLPVLPLTYEAFKPYGQVIQGYSFSSSAPKGIPTTTANQGTASKFHRLGKIEADYPAGQGKPGGVAIGAVKAANRLDVASGVKIQVELLERHRFTTQAFIPLGRGPNTPAPGGFIVVVALNGADDNPDLKTVRAFLATAAQGVSFDRGIWHHSLLTVGGDLEYAVVEQGHLDPSSWLYVEKVTPSIPTYLQIPPFPPKSSSEHTTENAHLPIVSHLGQSQITSNASSGITHPELITPDNFAPFGHIISTSPSSSHKDSESSPDGKTTKHNVLAPIVSFYPADSGAVTGISVYRATKKVGLERGREFEVRYMERHEYTSQAFIPMGKAEWHGKSEEALAPGGEFLVIVAKAGADGKPDPSTLKSFIMPPNTGLSYAPGVWHHPVLILDSTIDLACVETQISTGVHDTDERDCELISWEGKEVFGKIAVPVLA
ncbi:allantoicase [Kwoniella heveanensis CBS 569]|nr:allantoicase [Kwoniella heveanensis CBS 569]